ncbi:hypothetical protein [Tahibacter harae]|uniref:4-amino-4-deoxy-L-arabinose transferase-like glycosyltransferase n=1 Tax=Tahibacter harae TaxID=2963937 RepID=A0ABT1QXG4_9GAMM|nr:hypothetical protein [Tahibacter harae]MCQ4166974.1 hypothetical protein [Tahibacter harae]
MNSSQWTSPPPRAQAESRWFGWLVGVLVFAGTLRLGIGTATGDVDLSWSAVIAWAHVNGAQWGKDIIFTYGPLGWLNPYATYNQTLFATFFLCQVLLSLGVASTYGMAANLVRPAYRLPLLLTLAVLWPWLHSDILFFGTLAAGMAALERCSRSPGRWGGLLGLGILSLLIAALGLLKFSFFIIAAGLWLAGTLLLSGRRLDKALLWFAAFPAATLALWVADGQELGNLAVYFRTALDTASAYARGMGNSGRTLDLLTGAAAAALVAALLLAWVRSQRGAYLRALVVAGYLGATLFLVWRAAYTRADMAHVCFFLPLCAQVLVVLLGFAGDGSAAVRRSVLAALMLLLIAWVPLSYPAANVALYVDKAHYSAQILRRLVIPSELLAYYEADRARIRQALDLPQLRSLIGRERVDLLTQAQGVVLINEFNFAPRPIFQSYSALSPALLRINEAHFLGAQAPRFVLLKLEPADLRYPTSEDAPALYALLRNYQPAAMEKGYLLLQRRDGADAAPMPAAAASTIDAAVGEWVDVPAHASALLMHADLVQNGYGKVFSFLLREPATLLETQLSNGETRQYRLLRDTARTGLLLSPFIESERSYLGWYYGDELPQVKRLRIIAPVPWQQSLLQPSFRLGFTAVELPRAEAGRLPQELVPELWPGFNIPPTARSGMISGVIEEGAPALFMHATASLEFKPPAGRHKLELNFGLRKGTLEASECAKSDGIRLQVDLVQGTQVTTILQRDVDPAARPTDRGLQSAAAELQTAPGDTLRVSVLPGPAGDNAACDWGYVRDLHLTALPAP